eukprot:scaffold3038_cov163-Amphora_coffeaeformis.AAC.4
MSDNNVKQEGSKPDDAWRADFKQADRNKEVKEIARVLASLEPGASAGSKLRLAMQFEDTVFGAAESLDDYRKRLSKRLRKLQKNYRPPISAVETEKAKKIEALRTQYGEAIRYCLKHRAKAVGEMKNRYGAEQAGRLEEHLKSADQWAVDLGLWDNTQPNKNMSNEHLERLKASIDRRLDNIRSHVVKCADPDQFFAETLAKAEDDCREGASKILAHNVQRRYEQLHKSKMSPEKMFQHSIKSATASLPLSTRNQRNDERDTLIWLVGGRVARIIYTATPFYTLPHSLFCSFKKDKMRAVPAAALAFLGADDKSKMPKGVLTKLNDIAKEGNEFVMATIANRRKNQSTPEVSLEDAWMKTLSLPGENEGTNSAGGRNKPISAQPVKTRSKILFTPGRKTPPNLLAVFRMKQATLVRPSPQGEGSHLILHFGKAFTMTIYFVPLLVRLTAFDEKSAEPPGELECAPWTSFSQGLTDRDDLTVWGAKGDYASLGHVVEERLRDASAHATRVLRRLVSSHTKENALEFETEILEGTALVEFLQLSRTTYMPNWEDII